MKMKKENSQLTGAVLIQFEDLEEVWEIDESETGKRPMSENRNQLGWVPLVTNNLLLLWIFAILPFLLLFINI